MLTKKQLEDAARCKLGGTLCLECTCREKDVCKAVTCDVAQTALAYRAMLERLEWSLRQEILKNYQHYCPVCERNKQVGHASDCELAKLLGEDR
jgi:hypothetical protein